MYARSTYRSGASALSLANVHVVRASLYHLASGTTQCPTRLTPGKKEERYMDLALRIEGWDVPLREPVVGEAAHESVDPEALAEAPGMGRRGEICIDKFRSHSSSLERTRDDSRVAVVPVVRDTRDAEHEGREADVAEFDVVVPSVSFAEYLLVLVLWLLITPGTALGPARDAEDAPRGLRCGLVRGTLRWSPEEADVVTPAVEAFLVEMAEVDVAVINNLARRGFSTSATLFEGTLPTLITVF
ncbi:hypothetical protein BDZ97DRAFT_1754412 [Flammula alnicola]|nr:hypothetical protein BDZ97DRAFT_1754412 [Flammula alnicola]